jgi:hypothetical protein
MGLYIDQSLVSSLKFSANTQIVGLLACARLYQATGDSIYLTKANAIIQALLNYFWSPSFGGVQDYYSVLGGPSGTFQGYDNALLIYALLQLGAATGADDVNFKDFLLGKPDNQYMDLAWSVEAFMNNYLWKVSPGHDVMGYAEWLNSTADVYTPSLYSADSYVNVRLATTNFLMYYNLVETRIQSEPWYTYYQTFLIYVGVGVGVLLFIIILVTHRRGQGTKLPKVVKGLLGGED